MIITSIYNTNLHLNKIWAAILMFIQTLNAKHYTVASAIQPFRDQHHGQLRGWNHSFSFCFPFGCWPFKINRTKNYPRVPLHHITMCQLLPKLWPQTTFSWKVIKHKNCLTVSQSTIKEIFHISQFYTSTHFSFIVNQKWSREPFRTLLWKQLEATERKNNLVDRQRENIFLFSAAIKKKYRKKS